MTSRQRGKLGRRGIKPGLARARRRTTRAGAARSWTRYSGPWALAAALMLAVALVPTWSCSVVDRVDRELSDVPTRVLFRDEPDVRVRVRKGAERVKIEAGARVVARSVVPSEGPTLILPAPVVVSASGGSIVIDDATGAAHRWDTATGVEILSGGPGTALPNEAATARVDGVSYPGILQVRPDTARDADSGGRGSAGDRFDVISVKPIETYLPGVLAKELYTDWPQGAFEAQAVAARTYALHERQRARTAGRPFDVEATTQDQVYGGQTALARAIDGAKNTRGVILTTRGEVLRAYYSSTCGGRPGSAADTWPTTKGFEYNLAEPIQGRAREHYCQGSTLYRWRVTRTDDELSKRVRAWAQTSGSGARSIGRVRSIAAKGTNRADRPASFLLVDDRGSEYTLSGEELRLACNFSASGVPPVTRETRVSSSDVEVEVSAGVFTISGRGFGHGVGMCQWCAKGMAQSGVPWRRMMEMFYPGAQLTKAY